MRPARHPGQPQGLAHHPEHFRRIRYTDPESGKKLIFITNNTALPALSICARYKSRWQVESFLKWIKQHLRIKHFLGNSENAVKTQIWCAVATYVLIAIVKKELKLPASQYTLLQMLSVSVFEKTQLQRALRADQVDPETLSATEQLICSTFGRTLVIRSSVQVPHSSLALLPAAAKPCALAGATRCGPPPRSAPGPLRRAL